MSQAVPEGYFAKNIDAVGYHDLNGKRPSSWPCRKKIAAGISTSPIFGIAAGAYSMSPIWQPACGSATSAMRANLGSLLFRPRRSNAKNRHQAEPTGRAVRRRPGQPPRLYLS